ncbi:MAG: hypothetical protein ACYC5A_08305 [Thermoleophilia bacterium]
MVKRRPGYILPSALAAAGAILLLATSCAANETDSDQVNRLSGLATCSATVEDRCDDNVSEFPVATSIIYATITVHQPVDGTEALATMTRLDGDSRQKVLAYSLGIEPEEDAATVQLVFFFDSRSNTDNNGQWDAGEYELAVEVHASDAAPVRTTIRLK